MSDNIPDLISKLLQADPNLRYIGRVSCVSCALAPYLSEDNEGNGFVKHVVATTYEVAQDLLYAAMVAHSETSQGHNTFLTGVLDKTQGLPVESRKVLD